MKKFKSLLIKYREIILYLVFGVLTTVVSWGTYAVFELVFRPLCPIDNLRVAIANVLSWICAVAFAFVTNKIWVFDSKSWAFGIVKKELITFVGSRIVTGCLEWFGVPLLIIIGLNQTIFGIKGMVAKVLVSVIVVILNYILSKLLVFKNKKND